MALFPQGFDAINGRCDTGERKVLHALKRHLEDDYCIWHNVPLGPKRRQPDFVILNPRRGVLLLEVKDWKRSTLRTANPDSVELETARGRVTEANPLRQARDYAMELATVMQRDPGLVNAQGPYKGKLIFPYGWGVVFSRISRAETQATDFEEVFPAAKVLLQDDLADTASTEAFQERLWQMFAAPFTCNLTIPQRDRIRWHLFPEVRINQPVLEFDPAANAAVELPDLMQVMDLQQEQLARTLGDGHRVIHGVAGSGKTMILIYRAEQLARDASATKPVLVLCFNKTLAGRLESLLRARNVDERVVVRHFHGWCADLVKTYHLQLPADGDAEPYQRQAVAVCRAIEAGTVPSGQYASILIDEGHDFDNAWLSVAAKMVDRSTESLLVLYDDAQAIYKATRRRTSFSSLGIKAVGRTNVLKINYRNTAEILLLAMRVAGSTIHPDEATEDTVPVYLPKSGGRRGPLPLLIEAPNAREEATCIAQEVAKAVTEGMALRDIAVFCRSRDGMRPIERALKSADIDFETMPKYFKGFDWSQNTIKLVTMHSCKGLEFPLAFVAGLQALPHKNEPEEDELRLLYVAMTRATNRLVLTASGSSSIVDRVRTAIQELQVGLRATSPIALRRVA
jgi:superfamily I DNA and RNA helicase